MGCCFHLWNTSQIHPLFFLSTIAHPTWITLFFCLNYCSYLLTGFLFLILSLNNPYSIEQPEWSFKNMSYPSQIFQRHLIPLRIKFIFFAIACKTQCNQAPVCLAPVICHSSSYTQWPSHSAFTGVSKYKVCLCPKAFAVVISFPWNVLPPDLSLI